MKKKSISILLAICLAASLLTVNANTEKKRTSNFLPLSDGIHEITSGKLRLTLNTDSADISVENLSTGQVWTSNPAEPENDKVAAGENKTRIRSQLCVTFTNEMRQQKSANSYADCIKKSGCKFFKSANVFRVEYYFASGDFSVPVEYRINGNVFSASIVMSQIYENGKNKLNTVTLLPFFGAGGSDDKGEIFVPDGCGAIIKMNNGKINCSDYIKRYYGEDPTLPASDNSLNSQNLLLPVFGMIKNGGAFLARISSGAEMAQLEVSPGGKNTSYNTVCTSADYRCVDRESALENDSRSSYAYLADNPVGLERYTVDYIFSDSPNASLSEFVKLYRGELEKNIFHSDKQNASQNFVAVDFWGGVKKKTSFLGIVYTGKLAVTSFKEMREILSDISKNTKQDISAQILHYSKGEFSGTAGNGIKPSSFLGGKSEYNKLISFARENGIAFYPSVELSLLKKGGNGFSVFRSVVSEMNQQSLRISQSFVLPNDKSTAQKSYLLNSAALEKAALKTADSVQKYKADGVYFTASGTGLYSDFGKNCSYRTDIKEQYEKGFKTVSQKAGLCFEAAYEYMLPYAERIVNVPVGSSGDILFDYDVPFYQMAVMGKLPYSSNSYNSLNPGRDYFLACIETGTALKFTLGYDETELLGISDSKSHNIGYKDLRDTLFSLSDSADKLFSRTEGAVLVGFTRYGNELSKGTYDNGVTVYTNRGKGDAITDGITVPAQDFVVISVEEERK